LRSLLDYFVELGMVLLPQDRASMGLKRWLLCRRGTRIGARTKIWRDVWIDDYQGLVIGNDVTIGRSVMLLCGGRVAIGDRVMIGHGAKIISSGHRIPEARDTPMRWSGPEMEPIHIAEDAWIGAGAIVLAGAHIGRGAVVAAGAVVARPVPDYAVVAGVPARVMRKRAQ
jgi:acetyltransferase-like isoleucine patch superfamily enzyme